jgi:ABC-type sugar transport system substrate-binding protein
LASTRERFELKAMDERGGGDSSHEKTACRGARRLRTELAGVGAQAAERLVFVGHWPESDSFFNVIRNSAQLAATQMGVTVEFRNPPGGDLSQMARLIDQATASKPSAIISTVP